MGKGRGGGKKNFFTEGLLSSGGGLCLSRAKEGDGVGVKGGEGKW